MGGRVFLDLNGDRRWQLDEPSAPGTRLLVGNRWVTADADGYPEIGADGAEIELTGSRALVRSLGILGTCIAQAPEFVHKKRTAER